MMSILTQPHSSSLSIHILIMTTIIIILSLHYDLHYDLHYIIIVTSLGMGQLGLFVVPKTRRDYLARQKKDKKNKKKAPLRTDGLVGWIRELRGEKGEGED